MSSYDLWLMTYEIWLMKYDLWNMTYEIWLMTLMTLMTFKEGNVCSIHNGTLFYPPIVAE